MYKKIILIILLSIFVISCSNNNLTNSVSMPEPTNTIIENYKILYKPIIDAYIELEQSNYATYDKSILGNDVCLIPDGRGSYFIEHDSNLTLRYTFHDLSGNGVPELLIGAKIEKTDVFVTGIYGLQNNKSESLIQANAWSQLHFLTDSGGNCIIEKVSGTHIDYIEESFYRIGNKETLITLDKFYTYGKINDHDKPDDIMSSYARVVNGEKESITEQEYLTLKHKYIGNSKHYSIPINSWKALTEYK